MKGRDAQSRQAFLRALELDPNNTGGHEQLLDRRKCCSAGWTRRPTGDAGRSGSRDKRGNDYYHLILPLLNLRADAVDPHAARRGGAAVPDVHAGADAVVPARVVRGADGHGRCRARRRWWRRNPQNEEVKIHRADMAFLVDAPDLEVGARAAHAALGLDNTLTSRGNAQAPIRVRARQARRVRESGRAGRARPNGSPANASTEATRRRRCGSSSRPRLCSARIANAALDWLERALDAAIANTGSRTRPDPGGAAVRAALSRRARSHAAGRRRAARARRRTGTARRHQPVRMNPFSASDSLPASSSHSRVLRTRPYPFIRSDRTGSTSSARTAGARPAAPSPRRTACDDQGALSSGGATNRPWEAAAPRRRGST